MPTEKDLALPWTGDDGKHLRFILDIITSADEPLATFIILACNNHHRLLAALKEMESRYTGLFDCYCRPTYYASSNPDDDLSLALHDTRAAIAAAEAEV